MTILFVCEGNVARSQMAAAFFAAVRPDITVISAGTAATLGKPLDPKVLEVMAEDAVSMENAFRKSVSPELIAQSDLVVTMVPIEQLPSSVASVRFWPVPDPRGRELDYFNMVRDDIRARVQQLAAELAA